ncbi:hypothetical protein NFI96_009058, partial [Prochilodus magdalenae]
VGRPCKVRKVKLEELPPEEDMESEVSSTVDVKGGVQNDLLAGTVELIRRQCLIKCRDGGTRRRAYVVIKCLDGGTRRLAVCNKVAGRWNQKTGVCNKVAGPWNQKTGVCNREAGREPEDGRLYKVGPTVEPGRTGFCLIKWPDGGTRRQVFVIVAGRWNQKTGVCNKVAGQWNQKTGVSNKVAGRWNQKTGVCNKVAGRWNQKTGVCNKVAGRWNQKTGVCNKVAGRWNQKTDVSNKVAGWWNQKTGVSNKVAGRWNQKTGVYSTAEVRGRSWWLGLAYPKRVGIEFLLM